MNQQALIQARDLHKYYTIKTGMFQPNQSLQALSGASFDLYAGQTLAVVGESGCGKSTLARLLTLIEQPTAGQLSLDGIDLGSANKKEVAKKLRQTIQMVFQDPFGSLNPRQKVGDILQEPLIINTDLNANQRRDRVLELMQRVGLLDEHIHRYPHMFSGGQRQRIAIARALILKPKIVVLDEPVSALELGLAYVFISHDLSVVRHIADQVLVMYLGKPVEQGLSEAVFNNPQHPYTQALLSATPQANTHRKRERIRLTGELPSPLNPPSGCSFHPRCQNATAQCKITAPVMEQHGDVSVACLLVK